MSWLWRLLKAISDSRRLDSKPLHFPSPLFQTRTCGQANSPYGIERKGSIFCSASAIESTSTINRSSDSGAGVSGTGERKYRYSGMMCPEVVIQHLRSCNVSGGTFELRLCVQ